MSPIPDHLPDSVHKAYVFARRAHAGQTRIDGFRPYIMHPVAVMQLLLEHGHTDPNLLAAALLHDVIEDCNVTKQELEINFNTEVADLVSHVSDDPTKSRKASKAAFIANAASLPSKVKILKGADRLHNLTDLYEHEPKKWRPGAIQGYTLGSITLMNAIACEENQSLRAAVDNQIQLIFSKYGE